MNFAFILRLPLSGRGAFSFGLQFLRETCGPATQIVGSLRPTGPHESCYVPTKVVTHQRCLLGDENPREGRSAIALAVLLVFAERPMLLGGLGAEIFINDEKIYSFVQRRHAVSWLAAAQFVTATSPVALEPGHSGPSRFA